MVTKTKPMKEIVVDNEHYIPVEPSEPILPLHELGSRLGKSENEKWTTCKVVADKETGEKILLVRGIATKEKDRSKRMVKKGGELASDNIVSGTRRRKNINYKENTERKESRKTSSKNTFENRSKAVEKAKKKSSNTSKKRKAKEEEHDEEEEDKENIENQQEEEEEIIQAPKKSRKNRKSISKNTKKEAPKEEEQPKEEEWKLPLSPVVCQLIQNLGGELPTDVKKRCYQGSRLSEPVNYWCGVKWPEDTLYVIDTAKTNGETVGLFKHELFELSETDGIQFIQQNPNAIMLADGEGLVACLPDETNDSDFMVHIILEATEGAEECVYHMKLSEYLASLSVDNRKMED